MTPEDKAHQKIDELIRAAVWVIQDGDALNHGAGLEVIVRHCQLGNDEVDYMRLIDRKAARSIEAKNEGITLSVIAEQVVLNIAFKGELVPHCPSHEPVSELLKRIQVAA